MVASKLCNHDLDGSWDGSPRDWLARHGVTQHTEFDESLGTVGAGNRFAEVRKRDKFVNSEACKSIGLREGEVYLQGELLGVILESNPQVSFIAADMVHAGSRGLGSSILQSSIKSDANPYITSATVQFQGYLDHHDHAVECAQANRDLVAHRIKYCPFEKGPNPVDAEEGGDTHAHRIAEAGESRVGEDEPDVDLCEALEKLLDVTHNGVVRREWIVNG